MLRVSVFMNVFNCHVNRVPVSGTIRSIAYSRGRFLNAELDKASTENERNALVIESEHGAIGCVQIAGLVARRIICWCRVGEQMEVGERFGLIRFGSRLDVFLPEGRRAARLGRPDGGRRRDRAGRIRLDQGADGRPHRLTGQNREKDVETPFPPFEPDGPEAQAGRGPRLREISPRLMVPNLITVLAICAGLTGVRLAFEQRFETAVAMVLLAAFLDGIDGRVARLLKATSKFGAQMDSLADIVNFGVAPALVLYVFLLDQARSFGWIAAMMYAIAAGLRLARFNVMAEREVKAVWQSDYFIGVPAPAGAMLVLLPVYLGFLGMPAAPAYAYARLPLHDADRLLPRQPPAGLFGQVARRAHPARPRPADPARPGALCRLPDELHLGDDDADGACISVLPALQRARLAAALRSAGKGGSRCGEGLGGQVTGEACPLAVRRADCSSAGGPAARRRAAGGGQFRAAELQQPFRRLPRDAAGFRGSSPGIACARIAVRVAPGLTLTILSGRRCVSAAHIRPMHSTAAFEAA